MDGRTEGPAAAHEAEERAGVVVVGGGVIGASTAWHLTRLGVRDVLVLDREREAGSGSTGRATGGFRSTFATRPNIELSLLARETLRRFPELVGSDPVYRPVGYLWIARSDAVLATLADANALQRSAGVPEAEIVAPADVYRLNPALAPDDAVRGALWCPTDGYVRPLAILDGFRRSASAAGAVFSYGEEVTALPEPGVVVTGRRRVRCDVVVNAAGAWAARVGALAGIAIPVEPVRRQVAITAPTDALPADMPMTLWADDGFHLRVRDGRVLYAWPTPGDPDDAWSTAVDPAWVEQAARTARERVPALAGVPVDLPGCWGGLYEVSPDRRPLIGRAAGRPDLVLANGSSGHGVMHAAAIGRLVAELVTGRPPSIDPAPFDPGRFARGTAGAAELL